ncbi:hypothetical protein [Tabrizicola aquatica]|uniref:hypothetical protein n=1 Tax=Tabrizicola aquatica TaxID=909926 RepID=UPI0011AFD0BD|nr:hypothetical protein [Tabrizicola aquatica]
MRVPRFLLSSAAIACCLSLPAVAEPTNAELDQRLRAVEGNISAILELLKAQQATTSSDALAAAAPETGYSWGGLYLDVFLLPLSEQELSLIYEAKQDIPSAPQNSPVASTTVKAPTSFKWGALSQQAELSRYVQSENSLQVRWSGVFNVINDGKHTFVLNLFRNGGEFGPAMCRSVLAISEEPVLDIEARPKGAVDFTRTVRIPGRPTEYLPFDVSKQTDVDLVQGVYDISIFLTCFGNREDAMKGTQVELRLLEPGDRAPKAISPERFGIRT